MQQIDTPVLVGVGVLFIGAMSVGLAAAWYSGRRYAEAAPREDRPFRDAPDQAGPGPAVEQDDDLSVPRRQVRERAVRIVALTFLAAVAALVAISHDWHGVTKDAATDDAIYLLVGAGTLAVVFLQDLLPGSIPEGVRNWVEAGAALAFLTVLTGLSGGLQSPFVVGFFLVVGAASLSRDGLAPLVLALIAGLSYGAMGLLVGPWSKDLRTDLALIAFESTTLLLLAFIGTVAGREQRRARDAALRLARFDPLTGLYNRTHFFASMERELRLAERAGRGFALLMLDLDGLKPVNDSFGHHYGDRLLQAITEVIQRSVRATDTPARYGGDEFVILLPDTDASGGFVVAEKLRKDIGALSIRVNDRSVHTSVSIGLVAYPDDGASVEDLMTAVDAALYEAKRSGKDRIAGYTTRTERVATRMGAADREPVTVSRPRATPPPAPPGEPPPGESSPAPPGEPPPAPPAATAGHAPWETETRPVTESAPDDAVPLQPPGTTDVQPPGSTAVQPPGTRAVQPPGTTAPPVPRRLVALDVEGDPSRDATAARTGPTERR